MAVDSRRGGRYSIDVDAARQKAEDFLSSKGFTGFEETGWRKSRSGDRIVFAYVPQDVLKSSEGDIPVRLYPDTVKVEIALDSGRVASFDQMAYLITHDHPGRVLRTPLVSANEAQELLKSNLDLISEDPRLCVIPVLPTTEVMAWEFKVRQDNEMYLVYVNAMTGNEQVVLQVIQDESGSMAL